MNIAFDAKRAFHNLRGLGNNVNILTLIHNAIQNHSKLMVSSNEWRGFTDVRTVAKHIVQCTELPGGVYNFGSSNNLNCYQTFCKVAQMMGIENVADIIVESHHEPKCNIVMNSSAVAQHGINFADSIEAIKKIL